MTRMAKVATLCFVASFLFISLSHAEMVDYRKLYRNTSPTVVFIAALTQGNFGSSGTGSVITREGHVITNHHVIWDDKGNRVCPRIFVFLKPPRVTGENANDLSRQYRAKVLHYDAKLDLAVLQILNPPQDLKVLPMQDSDLVETGAPTIAIGHPEQGVRWTLTTGAVSGQIHNFNRIRGKNVFQMETSVNRGNSGGPLIDHLGNMIGINSMIARVGAGGVAITDINFAIQTNVAKQWLASHGVNVSARPAAYAGEYESVQYDPGEKNFHPPETQANQDQLAEDRNGSDSSESDEGRRAIAEREEPRHGVMISNRGETNIRPTSQRRQEPEKLVSLESGQEYASDEDPKLRDHLAAIRAKMRAFERGDAKSIEEDAERALERLRNRRHRR